MKFEGDFGSDFGIFPCENSRKSITREVRNRAADSVNALDHRRKNAVEDFGQNFCPLSTVPHQGFGQGRETTDVNEKRRGFERPTTAGVAVFFENKRRNEIFHRLVMSGLCVVRESL